MLICPIDVPVMRMLWLLRKVKKGQGATHAFLTFRSFEERDSAIEYFNKMTYRGQTLAAAPAAQFEDRKRNFPTLDARHNSKRQRRNGTEIPLWEQLCDKVTPLWRHDYDKQLILKRDLLRKKLKAISNELYKVMQHTNVSPAWLNHSRKLNGGLICPLENLIPSPRLDGYRNKCEVRRFALFVLIILSEYLLRKMHPFSYLVYSRSKW